MDMYHYNIHCATREGILKLSSEWVGWTDGQQLSPHAIMASRFTKTTGFGGYGKDALVPEKTPVSTDAKSPPAKMATTVILVATPDAKDPTVINVRPYRGVDCKCTESMSASQRNKCSCWVRTNIAPNGHRLQGCVWHSDPKAGPPGADPTTLAYTDSPSQYAYWMSDYRCYDLCWLESEARLKDEAARYRKLELLINERAQTYHRVNAIFQTFETVLEQRDKLAAQIGTTRAAIGALGRPGAANPIIQALERTVDTETKALAAATETAEAKWEASPQGKEQARLETLERARLSELTLLGDLVGQATPLRADTPINEKQAAAARARERFITTAIMGARDKLARAQAKLTAARTTAPVADKSERMRLEEAERNLRAELGLVEASIQEAARKPFFAVYSIMQDLKAVPTWKYPSNRNIEAGLDALRQDMSMYEAKLTDLSTYIPRPKQRATFDAIKAEMEARARTVADILSTAKQSVLKIESASVLGQLFIDAKGDTLTEADVGVAEATPQLAVKATVSAVRPTYTAGGGSRGPRPASDDEEEYDDEPQAYSGAADKAWGKGARSAFISRW